jgi:hypothetical protein
MRLVLPRREHALKTAACLGCLLLCLLAACSRMPFPFDPTSTVIPAGPVSETALPTRTVAPVGVSGATVTPAAPVPVTITIPAATGIPTATVLPPNFWQTLPVIPTQVSQRVQQIYQDGLALGNHPHVFSRIGDCNSAAPAFLVGFDGPYNLGAYTALQPAIDYFEGSFKRPSLAAKAGMNSAGLLTTLWTGKQCLKDESLLDCQYRLDRPSFAIITIGTNEAYYVHVAPGSFERNMRLILDDTISKGIVPVLGTKADNVEGDQSINATIARLAVEYQIPLWNFWLAAQSLPKQGMVDPEHLNSVSYANFTDFSIPNSLTYGVQMHNLTALQMLDFLRQQLGEPAAGARAATLTATP